MDLGELIFVHQLKCVNWILWKSWSFTAAWNSWWVIGVDRFVFNQHKCLSSISLQSRYDSSEQNESINESSDISWIPLEYWVYIHLWCFLVVIIGGEKSSWDCSHLASPQHNWSTNRPKSNRNKKCGITTRKDESCWLTFNLRFLLQMNTNISVVLR